MTISVKFLNAFLGSEGVSAGCLHCSLLPYNVIPRIDQLSPDTMPCRPDNQQQSQAASGSQGSISDEDRNASGSWLVDDEQEVALEGGEALMAACVCNSQRICCFAQAKWHCSIMCDHGCSHVCLCEFACRSTKALHPTFQSPCELHSVQMIQQQASIAYLPVTHSG